MAIKPYPFRPRVSECDVIEWMNSHRARGQLRNALVEAIRLHIALREGRFPEVAREKYGVAAPGAGVQSNREDLREALLSLVPELADEISKRLAGAMPVTARMGEDRDDQAEILRTNFVDSRMLDDDDE